MKMSDILADAIFNAMYDEEDLSELKSKGVIAQELGYSISTKAIISCELEVVDSLIGENQRLKNALKDILCIVDDSTGVYGYHLNGDIADWDEFVEIRNANQLISELEGDES